MTDLHQPSTAFERVTRGVSEAELRVTEWMLTSGHGAYAMGTVSGANTRRYHGLLVGTKTPPVDRFVALSGVIDRVVCGERVADLASHRFASETGGVTHPCGVSRLVKFEAGETVRWTYDLGGGECVVRELSIVEGQNRAELVWRVIADGPVRVEVSAMTALRGFHELFAEEGRELWAERDGDAVVVRGGGIGVRLEMDGAGFVNEPAWWDNFELEVERSRGFDFLERLFVPGRFVTEIPSGTGEVRLVVTMEPNVTATPAGGRAAAVRERAAAEHVVRRAPGLSGDPRVVSLVRAADAFVVRREIGGEWSTTILAGYPWFADWGRDAMIALPGLLLTTGRFGDAKEVLSTFAAHTRRGLVPNRFDDYGGEPHYNTVDASLWFLHAAHAYATASGDGEMEAIAAACGEIVDAYRDGTDFGIRMDPADGLIMAGGSATQLTWMDAKTGDVAHTPRQGKAVEINALWVHGLRCAAELLPDRSGELRALADRASSSFATELWNADRGCLFDHLSPQAGGGWEADGAIRPNQVFAASLEFGPLNDEQRRRVVETVRRELLTPMGLRTLGPTEAGYRGRYDGGPGERDSAYHNGTVWPWLIGAYVEASVRAEGFSNASKERARRELSALLESLGSGCVGQIAEIYDGDGDGAGQRPAGCPAQAWSVAEVLRALALVSA